MHPSSMQSCSSTSGGIEQAGLMGYDTDMAENIEPPREEAEETMTLSSVDSQGTEPEQEVSIWCDEKELQNERRQTLSDALNNLSTHEEMGK